MFANPLTEDIPYSNIYRVVLESGLLESFEMFTPLQSHSHQIQLTGLLDKAEKAGKNGSLADAHEPMMSHIIKMVRGQMGKMSVVVST